MYIIHKDGKYVLSNRKGDVKWTPEIADAKQWKTPATPDKLAPELEAVVMILTEMEETFPARTSSLATNPKEVRRKGLKGLNTIEDWLTVKESLPVCKFEVYKNNTWIEI